MSDFHRSMRKKAEERAEMLEKKLKALQEKIAEAPVVYGMPDPSVQDYTAWDRIRLRDDTHTAKLVCIKEIPNKAEILKSEFAPFVEAMKTTPLKNRDNV